MLPHFSEFLVVVANFGSCPVYLHSKSGFANQTNCSFLLLSVLVVVAPKLCLAVIALIVSDAVFRILLPQHSKSHIGLCQFLMDPLIVRHDITLILIGSYTRLAGHGRLQVCRGDLLQVIEAGPPFRFCEAHEYRDGIP